MYGRVILNIWLFIVAFTLAFLASVTKIGQDRNDLESYSNHYVCLGDSFSSIGNCDLLLGQPYDFLYQLIAFLLKNIILLDFSMFIFVVSFFIFYTVVIVVTSRSKGALLTVLFLLVDFRFWEYGFNTLRYGLALSFLLIAYHNKLCANSFSTRLTILTAGISSVFHASGLISFALFVRWRAWFIVSTLFISILVVYFFDAIFAMSIHIIPIELSQKLNFYLGRQESGYAAPIHYTVILLYATYLRIFRRIVDSSFTLSFSILLALVVFSIALIPLGLSYRAFSFMTPFIAIIFGWQVFYISRLFGDIPSRLLVYLIASFFLLILALKNYSFILRSIDV
jgi:hypothetical protein